MMNALCKFAIAATVGLAAPLAPTGEALAGPVGAAASAVASFAQPIERTQYSGYGHRHRHFAPSYSYHRAPRPYPYHTYVSPYRYHGYQSGYRHYARGFGLGSGYGNGYGYGYRPHYRSVAPSYSAAPVSPYFTGYSAAGTVSYPVYRVDQYKVDYANPIVTYQSQCCGW